MTEKTSENDLKNIPSHKTTGLDAISVYMLKAAIPAILPSLLDTYNTSIKTTTFSRALKKAQVTALYKKDSPADRSNYRPISVLPILSKPLERHVSVTYQKRLLKYNLLYKNKSTYRPNYFCETALINITDRWLKEMDNGKIIGVILLDLSKAFDLVNHDIRLTELSVYLTCEHTMHWFKSYFGDPARRNVSCREKHQYRFLLHWGFLKDQFWAHYFFQFTSMICHFLYKILNLICMPMTLPSGKVVTHVKVYNSLQESLDNANCLLMSRTKTNRRTDREQYTRSNAATAMLLTSVKPAETLACD